MAQTVAVDFDGVIHAYRKGWHDGTVYDEPMPGAIDGLRRLQERYAVYILTTRRPWQVLAWLQEHGVPCCAADSPPEFWDRQDVVLVTNHKLPAVAYLDDRAVRFVDWDIVDAQITRQIDTITPTVDAAEVAGAVCRVLRELYETGTAAEVDAARRCWMAALEAAGLAPARKVAGPGDDPGTLPL